MNTSIRKTMRKLTVIFLVTIMILPLGSREVLSKSTGIAYQKEESNYFHRKSNYFGRKSAYHVKSKNSGYFGRQSAYVNPKHKGYFRDNRSFLKKLSDGFKNVFTD